MDYFLEAVKLKESTSEQTFLERVGELLEAQAFLHCLEAMGVDSWEGYSHAQDMLNEE